MRLPQRQQGPPYIHRTDTVEVKACQGNATDGSDGDDLEQVHTPDEVIPPKIAARVEEGDHVSRLRIKLFVRILLARITVVTGVRQISSFRRAASADGIDMVYMECVQRERLGTPAVLTAFTRASTHLTPKRCGNVGTLAFGHASVTA